MSNLCLWRCVLISCAIILCIEGSETRGYHKNSLTSDLKREANGNTLLNMYKFHPFLKNIELSGDMTSLLRGLKRRKRVTHHGLRKKGQNSVRIFNSNRQSTPRTNLKDKFPEISINDIESQINRRDRKVRQRSKFPSHGFRRRRRIPHHGSKKKICNQLKLLECSDDITTTDSNVDIHYLQNSILPRSQNRKYEGNSLSNRGKKCNKFASPSLVLKRRDVTPFMAVAKKLTDECNNLSENVGWNSKTNYKLNAPRLHNQNPFIHRYRKNVLKRDVPSGVISTGSTETTLSTNGTSVGTLTTAMSQTTIGSSDSTLSSQSTTGTSESTLSFQSTLSPPVSQGIQSFDFVRSVNDSSGGSNNETCDREVPCNMGDTLEEILQAVDEIAHEKGSKTAHEDFPCDVAGSWVTEAGGVRLDITVGSNNALQIAQYETVPIKSHPGFLCNDTWILNGTVPLNNSGIIMITGVNSHDRRVATFIGECKVCKHKETIAGHWLYVRQARDCSDEKNSYQILSDLWIRESLHAMRKQRLEMLKPGAPKMTAETLATTHAAETVATTAAVTVAAAVTTAPGATTIATSLAPK